MSTPSHRPGHSGGARWQAWPDWKGACGPLTLWSTDATNFGRSASHDRLKLIFESLRTAFPDRQYEVHDLIAEGDKVVSRITVHGTFGAIPPLPVDGLRGITTPPTGKPYAVQHVHIWHVIGGKIVEHWAARDDLGLQAQLGLIALPQRMATTP